MTPSAKIEPTTTQLPDALGARKAELRAQVLASRDALATDVRAAQTQACMAQLLALPEWQAARRIMAYASFGSELDTAALLAASVQAPRRLVLPRVERVPQPHLSLHWVHDTASLIVGTWGIREPARDAPIATLSDLDCVVVPGVAFDHAGNRLGYGKGFYDRALHGRGRALKVIALALECQVVRAVPHSDRDERIDILITPQGIWRFDT